MAFTEADDPECADLPEESAGRYDELVRLHRQPDGPRAGLAALDPGLPRYSAVAAYLQERDGDPVIAARLCADAARAASTLPERDHLTRESAGLTTGQLT